MRPLCAHFLGARRVCAYESAHRLIVLEKSRRAPAVVGSRDNFPVCPAAVRLPLLLVMRRFVGVKGGPRLDPLHVALCRVLDAVHEAMGECLLHELPEYLIDPARHFLGHVGYSAVPKGTEVRTASEGELHGISQRVMRG